MKLRIIMLENFLREYNVNRVFLSSLGLWPFQNKSIRNFLRTFFFLIEISYCPFEILLLYDHLDNPQMVFDASYQFMMSISFIGRQINEFWNHDKASFYNCNNMLNRFHVYCNQLRRLYEAIDQHWDIFTNDMEVQVMKNYSMLSRKFTKYYSSKILFWNIAVLMFNIMLILLLVPLTPILLDTVMPLNESRPRFFAIEVEFRVNKDDYFLPILCYTTVTILIGANVVMGVDAMHIACTAHACSLFAAIRLKSQIVHAIQYLHIYCGITIINTYKFRSFYRLSVKQIENLISKANNNKESNKCRYRMNMELDPLNEKLMYREYIICLKKHQLAIEFVNTLESSYQGISLLLLILLIGTISLIATRIIYVLDQAGEVIKFIFIFTACLITLMIVCYSGQRLMDESQSIFHRAYAAEWYKFSPRLKSLLIIILYRSNVPCGLKAGNMVPLSIATFAAVINTIALRFISLRFSTSEQELVMLANFLREYNVNRVFLSISGLWLFQNKNIKNSLRTVCLLMEISYYPFEILLLYDHWDDPQMVVDACYQFIFTTAFTARVLHNIWNQDKLQQLCIAIDKHWDIFTNDVEVRIMKDYVMLSRRFTIVFSMLLFFTVLIFVTIPLIPVLLDTVLPLNESRPRVFAIEVEFRVNKNDYFLIMFCYTTVVVIIGLNISIGVDTMHFTCTAHACSLFTLLNQKQWILIIVDSLSKFVDAYNYTSCDAAPEQKSPAEIFFERKFRIPFKPFTSVIFFLDSSSYLTTEEMKQHGVRSHLFVAEQPVIIKLFNEKPIEKPGTIDKLIGFTMAQVSFEEEYFMRDNQIWNRTPSSLDNHWI
ncbi:OR22B protein, partial [Pseudoatta argentina]